MAAGELVAQEITGFGNESLAHRQSGGGGNRETLSALGAFRCADLKTAS